MRRILETADNMPDSEFKETYRMSRKCFDKLLGMVYLHYPRLGLSPNGKSIIPKERLLIFLMFIASGLKGYFTYMVF